jgi:hypothetical protein
VRKRFCAGLRKTKEMLVLSTIQTEEERMEAWDGVVRVATDNREQVFLFLLYIFVASRPHDERLRVRRRNKKSGKKGRRTMETTDMESSSEK